jgi:hypothetical protein
MLEVVDVTLVGFCPCEGTMHEYNLKLFDLTPSELKLIANALNK